MFIALFDSTVVKGILRFYCALLSHSLADDPLPFLPVSLLVVLHQLVQSAGLSPQQDQALLILSLECLLHLSSKPRYNINTLYMYMHVNSKPIT